MLLTFVYSNSAFSIDKSKLSKNQVYFLDAYEAIKANDRPLVAFYKSSLIDYPLSPYLNYYDIILNFETTPSLLIDGFIQLNPDFVLTPKLIKNYLFYLAKNKQYEQFLDYYQADVHTDKNLTCNALLAEINTLDSGLRKEKVKMAKLWWQEQLAVSNYCLPLHAYLMDHRKVDKKMIWTRIQNNMLKGRIKKAKQLARKLSRKNRKNLNYWIKVYKKPSLISRKNMPSYMYPYIKKQVFKQAIKRYGYSKPEKSLRLLKSNYSKYNLNNEEYGKLNTNLSLRLAYKYHPNAQSYLAEIDKAIASKKVMNWRLQIAIRDSNWINYLDLYFLMPEQQQQKHRWLYWLARSLSEVGRNKVANKIYQNLAKKRNYYGFLSADKLNLDYDFNASQTESQLSEQELVNKYPSLLAIKELSAIDWKVNIKKTWYKLLSNADKKDVEQIAHYMLDLKQHRLAIYTVAKVKKWDDLELRFPTPYKLSVQEASDKNSLDYSWVYGVIRRESSFSPVAISAAGAIGLMQIMPNTARFISKKAGLKGVEYKNLKNPYANIKLGTAYLNYLSKKYNGNRVLATAAYNAGPTNVNSWIPKNKIMSADQWIDTIPFTETRDYVKIVLEYSTIFKSMLENEYDRLKVHMLPIGVEKTAITEQKKGQKKP